MLFQQDWSLIEECIAAGMAPSDEKLACNQGKQLKNTPFSMSTLIESTS
jgi:hypothetical protein